MKRLIGIVLVICGGLLVLEAMGWLIAAFVEGVIDIDALGASFINELWLLGVLLFLGVPGILMICKGQRILCDDSVSAMTFGEMLVMAAIIGILASIVLPVNNFSYVASRIVIEGVKAAGPTQRVVENYYSRHALFPGSVRMLDEPLPDRAPVGHVRSITIADNGRVVIVYDARDIDWGWSWWYRLLFKKSNDLTGQTVILVPSVIGIKKITWDECEEGTVPKRNRHFKCSKHK